MQRVLLSALVLLVANVAGAQTVADKFLSAVEKKAPPLGTIDSGRWKSLCVCKATNGVGGIETYSANPVSVTCSVPTFDAAGDVQSTSSCYDWMPLTK